jgi:hypothetical protein
MTAAASDAAGESIARYPGYANSQGAHRRGLSTGKMHKPQAKLLLSALRLLARNFRISPELREQFPNLQQERS